MITDEELEENVRRYNEVFGIKRERHETDCEYFSWVVISIVIAAISGIIPLTVIGLVLKAIFNF